MFMTLCSSWCKYMQISNDSAWTWMICHNNIIASFSSTAKYCTIFERLAPLPGHPTEPCTAIARGHVLVKAGGSLPKKWAYLLCQKAPPLRVVHIWHWSLKMVSLFHIIDSLTLEKSSKCVSAKVWPHQFCMSNLPGIYIFGLAKLGLLCVARIDQASNNTDTHINQASISSMIYGYIYIIWNKIKSQYVTLRNTSHFVIWRVKHQARTKLVIPLQTRPVLHMRRYSRQTERRIHSYGLSKMNRLEPL